MKRVVSVLLLVCMLVSLMGMGTAAYAEELADGAAVVEQTGDAPAAEQEPTGDDAEPETPTTPEQTQPTETPSTEGDGQNGTQEPEATPAPEVTAQPADEGFFAALSDEQVTALTADLAKLDYTVTDRAGLCALALELGVGDLESFCAWLDDELYLRDNAVAEVSGQLYITLDDALKVLENTRAAEIKLLNDVAVYGLEIPAAHELTLDLNGFALVLEMQEGETAPAPVTVADRMEKDENGDPVYSYAALTLKNGTVSAGDPNALAIYDAGRLALANVNVVGGIHIAESYERLTMLSIEPGDAFKTGFVNGAITADAGMDNAIRITGGDFITDVSSYIDTTAYECTKNEQTGLYTVARIKGTDITSYTSDDAANTANGAAVKVPSLKITAEPNAELDTAADVALDNASVKLAGLESALKETSLAEIIAAYEAAAPAQTQQARGMSRAVVIAAGDENADNAGNAADTSAVADGTELQLKVKAVLAAAVEDSSVSYEVKPYAVINGVEVPVKNEWLNGQAMLLSLYTGFLPKTVEHVHDDGTVETIDLNNCTYNNANGVLTMNVSEFSTFKATDGDFKTAINSNTDGEITLGENVNLTSIIEIKKDITINLNGKTLSMASTATGNAMFNITNGVTLTIKGGNVANSALKADNYVANLGTGSTLVLGDDTATNPMTVIVNTANPTPSGLLSAGDNKSVTIKCATLNVDPSTYTVAAGCTAMASSDGTSWTVGKPVAQITRTTGSIAGGNLTTETKYYDTLKAAIDDANATTRETIVLLANIDENPITIDKTVTINGTHQTVKYGITGNVTVTAGSPTLEKLAYITGNITYPSSTAVVSLSLNEVDVIGAAGNPTDANVIDLADNVTLNMTRCGTVNGSIQAGSSSVNINSVLAGASTNTYITGSITAGTGNLTVKKATVDGNIKSIGTSTGSPLRSVSIEDSTAASIIVMADTAQVSDNANASFTAKNVTASSITVGSADTTLAQRSVSITECTVTDSVTVGNGFGTVSVTGLTGNGAATGSLSIGTCRPVGTSTGAITIKGTNNKHMWIGTVNIADGNKNVKIEGISKNSPTMIGTVNINGSSDATFGDNTASSDTNDVKLEVGQIICQDGTVTINNGTYGKSYALDDTTVDSLVVSGTGTFELNGGNYHRDYSQYCDCTPNNDGSTQGQHYTHKECKLVATTIVSDGLRYRVSTLAPVVIVPASKEAAASITRGTQTSITFVTDAPYYHECQTAGNRDLFGVQVDNVYLTEGTQYTVAPYTYTHDGITETVTQVTLAASYVSTLTATTHRVNLDTEVGKVTSYADGNPVQIRVTLATANRRSGIIRTGDDSNIGLLIGIMVLALAVAVAVVVILKKKKSQTDANDVTNKTKPKEPKE